jgi:Lon protease-like protein
MPDRPVPTSLPEILGLFPLTGVLLLPGTLLPLHVFEPRYRHLVEDALAVEGVIGMIQPFAPRPDNRPLPGAERDVPDLYRVGCAGWIERHERTPDGRFLIRLRGINRFRVLEELPLHRGYRRVHADYSAFADRAPFPDLRLRRAELLAGLERFARAHGQEIATAQVDTLSDLDLLQALCVSLPFQPTEKQALLEAPTLADRQDVLLGLLRMGLPPGDTDEAAGGPVN